MTSISFMTAALLTFVILNGLNLNEAKGQDSKLNFRDYAPAIEKISTAELAKFKTLWVLSDVHGRMDRLKALFINNGLVRAKAGSKDSGDPKASELEWVGSEKSLVVMVGDYIDKGSDKDYSDHSGRVLEFLISMKAQAESKGSRFVILLGNHEAEFLASKHNADKDTMASFAKVIDAKDLSPNEILVSPENLKRRFGDFLRTMPAAAVIGQWFFAHSGFIDIPHMANHQEEDLSNLHAYFTDLKNTLAPVMLPGGSGATLEEIRSAYSRIAEYHDAQGISSLIEKHDWWNTGKLSDMKEIIASMGLTGLIVGHEPQSLKIDGAVGFNDKGKNGWMAKVDSGISPEAGGKTDHLGRMLKCSIPAGLVKPMATPGSFGCVEASPNLATSCAVPVKEGYYEGYCAKK